MSPVAGTAVAYATTPPATPVPTPHSDGPPSPGWIWVIVVVVIGGAILWATRKMHRGGPTEWN